MRFVDEVTIEAKAGRGGDGVIRWRQEKFIDRGGPAGGDGGRGGNVFVRALQDPFILAKYTDKKVYTAKRGDDGAEAKKHGADGEDVYLEVPVGVTIKNIETGQIWEIITEGQEEKILKGGGGGLGNEKFKSSTETTPYIATPGKEGEEGKFLVTLSLVADLGLVGLPNAGKSSLLNSITNANAKVGDYAFTTLDPNLGDLRGFIIADIPGLIEGASEGKGLGTKFLRHITRTKVIAHLVSCELGMSMMSSYKKIRNELETYGKGIEEKDEIIILTKTDILSSQEEIDEKIKEFSKLGKEVLTLSLFDDASAKTLSDELVKILRAKK